MSGVSWDRRRAGSGSCASGQCDLPLASTLRPVAAKATAR
jgi:hypothetical protein